MDGSPATFRFTVCICTRNRPDDLRKALRSVADSRYPVGQTIVSDDSTGGDTRAMVAAEFPDCVLVDGPRIGLGANRNNALRHVDGDHVLFIDDDVLLAPDFFEIAAHEIANLGDRAATTIVTGAEINHGRRVVASRPNFLGYMNVAYDGPDGHETIVINSTVFPATLFRRAGFDPSLVYGCEEMDMAVRAVHLYGYRIRFVPGMANFHFPSTINRDFYAPFKEASRIYVQYKRYNWVERRPTKAAGFLVVAYAHLLAHNLKARGPRGVLGFARTLRTSLTYIRDCGRDRARYV